MADCLLALPAARRHPGIRAGDLQQGDFRRCGHFGLPFVLSLFTPLRRHRRIAKRVSHNQLNLLPRFDFCCFVLSQNYRLSGLLSTIAAIWALECEDARVKRLVADLSLDEHVLTEALRKHQCRTTSET